MKRKGFTLVELLVVIAIIALLMGILMPALARVRQIAHRMVCGSNLSGIGKAMLIYANDFEEEFPIAGGPQATWSTTGQIGKWDTLLMQDAFTPRIPGAQATVSSSLFLLVKYADVTTKQFVCKGDVGTKQFKLSSGDDVTDVTEGWDFGNNPGMFCSYAYHMPYYVDRSTPGYPVNATGNPSTPVCADRNPYLDKNADSYVDSTADFWDEDNSEYMDQDKIGNSAAHQREGQNVLFLDSHVSFEKYPNVGVDNDNIWMYLDTLDPTNQERETGKIAPTGNGIGAPFMEKDAYLVNERNEPAGGGGGRGGR